MRPSAVVEVVEDLEFSYRQDKECLYRVPAGFAVERGQAICLWGTSGSGKSTLMTLLAALRRPSTGRQVFRFGGRAWEIAAADWPQRSGPALWRHIGFGFQRPELIRALDVENNLALVPGIPSPVVLFNADEWQRIAQTPSTKLSGGQVQRLGLLRAFGAGQELVFLDEPTNNLDRRNRDAVAELVKKQRESCGLVVVSHDEEFVRRLAVDALFEVREERRASRIVRQLVESGPLPRAAVQVLENPGLPA